MIEIKHRYTGGILFTSHESETLLQACVAAGKVGANLDGANLVGANLVGANLDGANLDGANLDGANLDGANLYGAKLVGAKLVGANLVGANLVGANLDGANLDRANLDRANLVGANLVGANLTHIRNDFWDVLLRAQGEVGGLRKALVEGKVNGSTYTGTCACLVGTIASIRDVEYYSMEILKPDSSRPIEKFFVGIKEGDTPKKNQIVKLVIDWIDEFQLLMYSGAKVEKK